MVRCLAKRLTLPLLSMNVRMCERVTALQQQPVEPWERLRHLVKRGKEKSASAPCQTPWSNCTQFTTSGHRLQHKPQRSVFCIIFDYGQQ